NLAYVDTFSVDVREHAASSARGFGRTEVSPGQGCELTLAIRGKRKTSTNIFLGEIGKLPQQLIVSHPTGKILQHICYGHPCPSDARFSASLVWFDGNDVSVIHKSIISQILTIRE